MRHPINWFIKHIGQKIYRNRVNCGCEICVDGFKNGVLVHDVRHAQYLKTCQDEMGIKYYLKGTNQ